MTTKLNMTAGDSSEIRVVTNQNLTDWKIRAQLWDATKPTSIRIKKATSNVPGGSDLQIIFTDVLKGKFTVFIATGDTTNFKGDIQIEIETENVAGKKTTIHRGFVNLESEEIIWNSTQSDHAPVENMIIISSTDSVIITIS